MTNYTQDPTVARTILQQLGGCKFLVMTGASRLVAGDNSLSFRLPAHFARDGINSVTVTLLPTDLYRVTFHRVWGLSVSTIDEAEGVYCDRLADIFESATGLSTRL